MHKMTGKIGYFAIKVDLSKAYDMLGWDFIEHILVEVGIPNAMLNVIMKGVTSVRTNVKWNGVSADYFSRSNCRILPYLFVMGMDKLSHLEI
jgi:hypothetical protein